MLQLEVMTRLGPPAFLPWPLRPPTFHLPPLGAKSLSPLPPQHAGCRKVKYGPEMNSGLKTGAQMRCISDRATLDPRVVMEGREQGTREALSSSHTLIPHPHRTPKRWRYGGKRWGPLARAGNAGRGEDPRARR